jgi:hypothetical protein
MDAIARRVEIHPGMRSLQAFGEGLARVPLMKAELRIFLASTAEFFREVPGGILALALRIADDWMTCDRFGAVSRGAQVLYSAVDEFGLHQLHRGVQESHHEFFRRMAAGFGVLESELVDPVNVVPEARAMADLTRLYYRERSVAEGLGFHLASELTSDVEFNICLEGFRNFPMEYGLSGPDDPKLGFYLIHAQVEPMHGSTSRSAVIAHLQRDAAAELEVCAGVEAFMDCYGAFFRALIGRLHMAAQA